MFEALLSSPAAIRAAMNMTGLEAARLDYDRRSSTLWLSHKTHGQIRQIPIPTGVTLTAAEILDLLLNPPAAPADPAGSCDRSGAPTVATAADPP
jgi:hypothetical protein